MKTATTSFSVNMAFKGTVNPSTYKHVVRSLVLRLAKYASEFSPTLDTKDSVRDGGGDQGNGRGKTTAYLHGSSQTPEVGWRQNVLPERSDGLEIQRATVPHRRTAGKAQSSPRPLRTRQF